MSLRGKDGETKKVRCKRFTDITSKWKKFVELPDDEAGGEGRMSLRQFEKIFE
jgi:hypothetical protein